jgi:hypothetical protein
MKFTAPQCYITEWRLLRKITYNSSRLPVTFNYLHNNYLPITVAARTKAGIVFARSNDGIVGSNTTEGMDVCVCSVFVLSFV